MERVNLVLEEILRGYVQSSTKWTEFLPMVEFAIDNPVRASTTRTRSSLIAYVIHVYPPKNE